MKTKELKLKSDNELQTLLAESREKMREMRFKVAQRQLKKVSDVKQVKKDIAKIMTILNERKSNQPSVISDQV